jgi:hypothetical protein
MILGMEPQSKEVPQGLWGVSKDKSLFLLAKFEIKEALK